jgi:hypothetical protein
LHEDVRGRGEWKERCGKMKEKRVCVEALPFSFSFSFLSLS